MNTNQEKHIKNLEDELNILVGIGDKKSRDSAKTLLDSMRIDRERKDLTRTKECWRYIVYYKKEVERLYG